MRKLAAIVAIVAAIAVLGFVTLAGVHDRGRRSHMAEPPAISAEARRWQSQPQSRRHAHDLGILPHAVHFLTIS
jgi:hypothetical protein